MKLNDLITTIALAIARQEGFYTRGTPAFRNNNPGNIRELKAPYNFRVYKAASDGFLDLEKLIGRILNYKVTMFEFFAGQRDENNVIRPRGYPGFAPQQDKHGINNPLIYAVNVAAALKRSLNTDIDIRTTILLDLLAYES